MSTHLQEHYGDSIPSAQVDIILDLCDHQVDPSDDNTESCILCGKEISLSVWHDHVAAHMESLSLFVLPSPENDEEINEGSVISGRADALDSNDDGTGSLSKASSLGFSVAGDHGQTPAEFTRILADEEVGYISKLSTWEIIDTDDKSIPNSKSQIEMDLQSLIEDFERLRKTLEESIENGEKEHPLRRMHQLICDLEGNGYERTPIETERLTQTKVDVVQLSQKLLGKMHPFTLDSMASLASAYEEQDLWEEAELIWVTILKRRKADLGSHHPRALATMAELARVYEAQGKYQETETLYEQAFRIQEEALGLEHQSARSMVGGLGDFYKNRGRFQEAEAMYERVLRIYEKSFGPEDERTCFALCQLGTIYRIQGRLENAEAMYERALQGYEKTLGPEDTRMYHALYELGTIYKSRGRLQDAETMYKRLLQGCEKSFGPEDEQTYETLHDLGEIYERQGLLHEAEAMYKQADTRKRNALG